MRLLFIADPVFKLNPAGDSSLVMAREAMGRGDKVFWATPPDLAYARNHVLVQAADATGVDPRGSLLLGAPRKVPLTDMDAVFIRKDPPFDTRYMHLCWLLCFEEGRVFMMNRPSLLLRYHEKIVPLEAFHQGYLREEDLIPTFLSALPEAKDYVKRHGISEVVTKPFLGYGGRGVERHGTDAFLRGDAMSLGISHEDFIQPFQPEIHERGDRRVFFLDGEVIGHFARFPAEGDFISNLAQGGRAERGTLTVAETEVLQRLGKFLKATGIVLAGADLIGNRISEVNITSPTGLKNLESLEGDNRGRRILEAVDRHLKAGPPYGVAPK